jgi:FkbM family methyltransferase
MLFNLKNLQQTYNTLVKNIIHVGGHFGNEIVEYKKLWPTCAIEIFEPHPATYEKLLQTTKTYTNVICHNIALGFQKSQMTMYVEQNNEGQSNSLLKPKLHIEQYPHIIFNNKIEVEVNTLDSFNFNESYNFLNIDVQGFELEVLKGSKNTLQHIDYIICEVNNAELYENCCKVHDIDNFLKLYNFSRVETAWTGITWGDAFYIKKFDL